MEKWPQNPYPPLGKLLKKSTHSFKSDLKDLLKINFSILNIVRIIICLEIINRIISILLLLKNLYEFSKTEDMWLHLFFLCKNILDLVICFTSLELSLAVILTNVAMGVFSAYHEFSKERYLEFGADIFVGGATIYKEIS